MKKFAIIALALGFSGVANASADLFTGDGTSHVRTDYKSTLTRAEVLANTDSSNIANSMDGTAYTAPVVRSTLTRQDVIRKMEGYEYVEFGDGTSMNPWVKKRTAK